MSKSTDKTSLGNRMKEYEKKFELEVPYNEHLIIRLDGHHFSKFTKGFDRPFDNVLRNAMVETTKDLVKEFNASTGYVQSDEITLVIPKQYQIKTSEVNFPDVEDGDICINRETSEETEVHWENVYSDREDRTDAVYFGDDSYEIYTRYGQENKTNNFDKKSFEHFNKKYKFLAVHDIINNQIYSGRTQKIASLASAFCTIRFNQNLKKEFVNAENQERDETKFKSLTLLETQKVGKAWFDARVYGVFSDEEAFNSVMWRVRDAHKNARTMFSQTYMSHKSLQNLNGKEQTELTLKETGKDFNDMPESFKYGTFVKKETFIKNTSFENSIIKAYDNNPEVTRTRIISLTKPMTSFNQDDVKFIMAKTI